MLVKNLCLVLILSLCSSVAFADKFGAMSQAPTQTYERPDNNKFKKNCKCTTKKCAEDKYKHKAVESLYIGLDAQNNKFGIYKDLKAATLNGKSGFIKTSLFAGSVFVGYRDQNLGSEFGFTLYRHQHMSGTFANHGFSLANVSLKIKSYNAYFDSIYFIPLFSRLDLKASLGLGFLRTTLKSNQALSLSGNQIPAGTAFAKEKLGIRVGIGAQIHFAKCISASIMGRFQTGNNIFNHVKTVALAFAYHI